MIDACSGCGHNRMVRVDIENAGDVGGEYP